MSFQLFVQYVLSAYSMLRCRYGGNRRLKVLAIVELTFLVDVCMGVSRSVASDSL